MPTNPTHHLRPSTMAAAVAVDHHIHRHGFKPSHSSRRCRLRSFPHPDPTLLDLAPRRPFFHRSLSTPCLSSSPSTPTADADHLPDTSRMARIEVVGGARRRSSGIHALVVEAAIAIAFGAHPVRDSTGLGGAYFLRSRSSSDFFAVIKPADAAAAVPSAHAGETGAREVAAYLLDHGGFSGVPPTALIRISHPALAGPAGARKVASIQRFVPHDFDAGDLGPSRFSVASVHRIGILDVRLLNVDRHAGNILVKKPLSGELAGELVPIDHGLCLPEVLDDPYFEWLHWPQAAVPFSDLEADYISRLDPAKDAELLRSELPTLSESAIRILILCTTFLKRAAAAGLCLAEIGRMMTREFCGIEEGPSVLEALCKRAEEATVARTGLAAEDNDIAGGTNGDHEVEEFQFDMDCDGDGELLESCVVVEDVLDIPMLMSSRRKVLRTVNEEEDEDGESEEEEEKVQGGITRSMSFSVGELNKYEGGGGDCVCFKGMSEEEWGEFLERFEQLLPEAFEDRKSMGLKQRLGTSCRF